MDKEVGSAEGLCAIGSRGKEGRASRCEEREVSGKDNKGRDSRKRGRMF